MPETKRQTSNPYSRLAIVLYLFLIVLLQLSAQAEEAPQTSEDPPQQPNFLLWNQIGLGLNGETGRPLAVEPQTSLNALWGPFTAGFGFGTALGENLFDRLLLNLAWQYTPADWLRGSIEGLFIWRNYGQSGYDFRVGFTIKNDIGAQPSRIGFACRTLIGYSDLITTIPALNLSWLDREFLVGLGIAWFSGDGWEAALVISDFNPDDASLYLKTFIIATVGYRNSHFGLKGSFVLKYSDLFTYTAYIDGFAFRLFLDLPLVGVLPP